MIFEIPQLMAFLRHQDVVHHAAIEAAVPQLYK